MPNTYSAEQLGLQAPSGGFQDGGFYGGREYVGGTFSDPGVLHPNSPRKGFEGTKVSNETISQSNPNNVSYINSEIAAQAIQPLPQINYAVSNATAGQVEGLQSTVDKARKTLEDTLGKQKLEVDAKLATARQKEQDTLDKIGELSTPFRAELEKTQREALHINENFEANQELVNELDQLLTEGNNLIKQQQQVTGLSAIRNPRIQQTMSDVAARAGVIEAVMAARNSQIAVAENLIDRTVNAMNQDRQDQLNYYNTILNLNNRDIISLDADSKKIADEQISLLKTDLSRAQETQDYVKQLLLDPNTAAIMGKAGVSLNDSIETITQKIGQAQYSQELLDMKNEITSQGGKPVASPAGIPDDQLVSFTDSQGVTHYYKMPASSSGSSAFASDFIKKTLGIDSIMDQTVPISTDEYADIMSITDEVVAPNMSPSAGIGSTYIDSLGRKWIYESSGWRVAG